MISTISIIPDNIDVQITNSTYNYLGKVKEPAREFLSTLYVCDKDIVYNNPNVDITEAWLLNNNAYIYKIEDDDIVSLQVNEESCSGSTFEIGGVVSQQLTAKLVNSDEYQANCTTPDSGYDTYYENKCLIAFNRLALESTTDIYGETTVTQWASVPLGVYYVYDTPKINGLFIDLVCYDKMLELERKMTFLRMTYTGMLDKMKALYKLVFAENYSSMSYLNGAMNTEYLPTDKTYRDLLSYLAFMDGQFVRFNRYGKLQATAFTNVGSELAPEITSNEILKFDKKSDVRDLRIYSARFGSNNNDTNVNNGLPIKVAEQSLLNEVQGLNYLYKSQVIQLDDIDHFGYVAADLQLAGLPYLEVGDKVWVQTQTAVFDDETGEYTYTDDEPVRVFIHKQELKLTSGVAQSINSFDVDKDIKIGSTNTEIMIPAQNCLLDISYGKSAINHTSGSIGSVEIDVEKGRVLEHYEGFGLTPYQTVAVPKTTKPSKIYPPAINAVTDDTHENHYTLSGYSTATSKTGYSWLGIGLFGGIIGGDDPYINNGYLLADIYEEYHTNGAGYLLIDDFIIEWGVAELSSTASAGDDEYYADVTFYKEFAEEPVVALSMLTASPANITSCSYGAIPDATEIKTGMRIYNCNKVFSGGGGRNVAWLCIGRSKDD